MRTKVILACIMAAVSLALLACSSTPPASSECFFKWDQETEIAVGSTLTVTLESNQTTGFQWELVKITDETVLEEVSHAYVAPGAEGKVGAGGEEVWTFKGLKEGKSIIALEYRRPWEQEVEPDQVFVLTVVVK